MHSVRVKHRAIYAGIMMMAGATTAHADADGFVSDLWERTTFVGTIRSDTSIRTTSLQNFYNQGNQPYQHIDVPRQAYLPPALSSAILGVPVLPGSEWQIPIPNSPLIPTNDTVRRDSFIKSENIKSNYQVFRFGGEMNIAFTDSLRFNVQTRVLFDPDIYGMFDANDVANIQGGIPAGGADRYADTGRANFYSMRGRDGKKLNPTEFAGRKYLLDFPTLLLEYKQDAFNVRFGIQQIAWGQAIFFQTFDVPNGLDFRRHLVLGRAIEEFSDLRVPALALRTAVQASDEILVDSYISKFQPTIIPNPNTPFNVAPSQFYKPIDNYTSGNYDFKLNFGIRMKADYGNWGYSAMAASRLNPLGVIHWSESGVNKGLSGTNPDGSSWGNPLGRLVETLYAAKAPVGGTLCPAGAYNPTTCRMYDSLGEALSHTPLTISPGGVYSNREWFVSSGLIRLDARKLINTLIDEYPALTDVYASHVADIQQTSNLLNTFFFASDGGIRGSIQRDYYREAVFGLGGSYVIETETAGSFWDQFIVNVEGQYTPNRRLTGTGLQHGGERTNEYILTLVGEKWYRYTESFPAAYLAFEYQHRTASDLVGLTLNGYGGVMRNTKMEGSPGNGNDYSNLRLAKGINSADYLAFAGFQPWPNRKYVLEWAVLWDVRGGVLAQPLIKWNPGYNVSVDFFYNYVNGHLYGNEGNNLLRVIDWADEFNIRIGYQF